MADGTTRLRYRDGVDQPRLLQKDRVYEVGISELITANHSRPVIVCGCKSPVPTSPNFERNLHSGGNNLDEVGGPVATLRIHQSAQYPSRIELPTIALEPTHELTFEREPS